jgi:hypothetical protein
VMVVGAISQKSVCADALCCVLLRHFTTILRSSSEVKAYSLAIFP